jgi:MobA/MobL family
MVSKSLPSFKHSSIGAKTHKARTATAHVSYIMRAEAKTHFQAENMPDGGRGTRVFFDKLWEKAGMPENARICDKLMIALPNELGPEQRYEAVQTFMQELGHGRIAWCAAYHEQGEDAHNPHAHIVFKDADIDTGRKVIGTTTSAKDVREAQEHGWKVPPRMTTAGLRQAWCEHLNKFMERAGLDIRYDARKLKEQGIDREPQIPIGPKAQALEEKGYAFASHDQAHGDRAIAYSLLDQASRVQYNEQIIEANREKERADTDKTRQSREPSGPRWRQDKEWRDLLKSQAATRKAVYEEQKRDRDALRMAQEAAKLDHKTWAKQLYAGGREAAYDEIKKEFAGKWKDLRTSTPLGERKDAAAALKAEQMKAYAAGAKRQADLRRPEKDAAWKALKADQEKERLALKAEHRKENALLARQQAAERLALEERWRAYWLDKRAQHISVRLSSHQGMANAEKAAFATIKLHDKANSNKGKHAAPNPQEAAKAYRDIARAEESGRAALRAELIKMRCQNLERAGPSVRVEHMLSLNGKSATRSPGQSSSGRQDPRQIVLPGIFATDQEATRQQTPGRAPTQDTARQPGGSNQTRRDAERANTPPEIIQRLRDRERLGLGAGNFTHSRGNAGKGRSGGGRGR